MNNSAKKQSINQSEVHIRIGSWIIILQLGPLWDEPKVLGSSVQSSIAGEWGSSKSPYCCDCNWIDDRNPHRYSYNSDDRYRHEIFQRMILADLIATIHECRHYNSAPH